MIKPIVEVENVVKFYKQRTKNGVKAVNDVTFSIFEGESFGLVGESGSGKSTIGQLILQLITQTSGTVKYRGRDVTDFSRRERKRWRQEIQIVFQDPYSSLNPKKKIGWILEEALIIHKIGDKGERKKRVLKILDDVGLESSYLERYPHELSGGQRQRVAIASAIILNPKFIVIDEGVSALDVSVQAQILNLLKKLQRKYNLTYLFISHDLNVVQYFCDRIAVMYLGGIMEIGKTEELRNGTKHPYTEALFSSVLMHDQEEEQIVLKGDLPNSDFSLEGCPFYTRCKYAMEKCKTLKPVHHQMGEEHQVSCHLYGEKEPLHHVT